MDETSVTPKDIIVGLLVILMMLAALTFAGTIDHDYEVAHEQWMQQLEEEGAWVLR